MKSIPLGLQRDILTGPQIPCGFVSSSFQPLCTYKRTDCTLHKSPHCLLLPTYQLILGHYLCVWSPAKRLQYRINVVLLRGDNGNEARLSAATWLHAPCSSLAPQACQRACATCNNLCSVNFVAEPHLMVKAEESPLLFARLR